MMKLDSLMACVLKTKHFPNLTFLEAELGSNPSFTWKSIWSVKPLLANRVRWKVGNRKTIRVFKDTWVPNLGLGMIVSRPECLDEDCLVESLIDVNTLK
ncbi:hypothetical protein REPUB_Repub07fG0126300 [Reevesia pubescens]